MNGITKDKVKKIMEFCRWRKAIQFTVTEELTSKQLANALTFIAPGVKKEDVVALRDETFTHSGKRGMLLTKDLVYFNGDYILSSDRNVHHFDYSKVKRIHGNTKDGRFLYLEYWNGTKDSLDCGIYLEQIFRFFSYLIDLEDAGFGTEMSPAKQFLASARLDSMKQIFEKFPNFTLAENLPAKEVSVLKHILRNPFREEIVAFQGYAKPNQMYGQLFSTEYYYFLTVDGVKEKFKLSDILDIYPNHDGENMTAILKEGGPTPLCAKTCVQDDFELIFEEIRDLLNPSLESLKKSPMTQQERSARANVITQMHLLRNRQSNLPYCQYTSSQLIEMFRQLEADAKYEDLPYICYQIAYNSGPVEDSYYYAKSFLYQPLSRYSLSYLYYYLYCLRNRRRWCDKEVRCYKNPDYRQFIEYCNKTPLEEVHAQLKKELRSYRYLVE